MWNIYPLENKIPTATATATAAAAATATATAAALWTRISLTTWVTTVHLFDTGFKCT